MTDLRALLHDLADDAPDHDAIRRRLQRPDRRLTPVLAASGVIAVLGIAAVTAVFATGHSASPTGVTGSTIAGATPAEVAPAAPNDPWNASCFGAADLSTDLRADVGMGQATDAVNTAPRAQDYFDICGFHWNSGVWVVAPPVPSDGAVPPAPEDLQLVGCVLPGGTYGIFPGTDSVCAALGLPLALAPDPSAGVVEFPPSTP